MSDRIPNLTIERGEAGSFLLEQEWSGNVDRIELHPVHVRHLAELARLVGGNGCEYTPPAPVLARRLRVLLDRIDRLDDMLRAIEAKGHEDVEVESSFCFATWELAREFCADLGEPAPCNAMQRHETPGEAARGHASVTRDAPVTPPAETQAKPTGNPVGSAAVPAQLTLEG